MKQLITSSKMGLALAACCLGGLAGASVAHASLIQIKVTEKPGINGIGSTAYVPPSVAVPSGKVTSSWLGGIYADIVGGGSYIMFCTDIANSMSSGTTYFYEKTTFSSNTGPGFLETNPDHNGIAPDPLWANNGTSGKRAALIYGLNVASTVGTSTTARRNTAALQLAIWEALYQDPANGLPVTSKFDVTTKGTSARAFDATSNGSADATAVIALANAMLAPLNVASVALLTDLAWFKESDTRNPQSLIGPPNAVPEPSTYVAGALLLLPFVASTLRARRKLTKS